VAELCCRVQDHLFFSSTGYLQGIFYHVNIQILDENSSWVEGEDGKILQEGRLSDCG